MPNSCTLGGKPIYDPPDDKCGQVNYFTMPSGASRYGYGIFLMLKHDYSDMIAGASGSPVTLVIKDDASPAGMVSFPVMPAGWHPYSTSVDSVNDIVKVVVFDLRCQNISPRYGAINVQKDGFPLDGSNNPICYTETLKTGSPWTWAQAATYLEIPDIPSPPTWLPYNLIYDWVPQNRIIDDIAARLYLVVGFDPNATSANGLAYFAPGNFNGGGGGTNSTTYEKAQATALVGGSQGQRNPARLPSKATVVFRGFNTDNTSDPYVVAARNYTKVVNYSGSGTASVKNTIYVGDQVAVYNGSAFANQSTLDAVATDIAARSYSFISVTPAEYEFAGIWPFVVDGVIRAVQWVNDSKGARTRVKVNDDRDFVVYDDMRRLIETAMNQLVVGGGSTMVAPTTSGTRLVWGNSLAIPTGNVTGITIGNTTLTGGTYAGTIYGGAPLNIDPTTGNFTMPTTGETNGNSTIIIQVDPESGLPVHDIAPGATVPLFPTGGTAKIGNETYPLYRTTAQPSIPQLGIVVCTGYCDDEPQNDFSDNRYWVRTAQITNSGGSTCDPIQVGFYDDYRDATYATTNLNEVNCGTHLVRPNSIVSIWGKPDQSDPPMLRWFMDVGDEGTCGSPPCNQSSSSSSSSSAYNCIYRFDAKYNCDVGQWQFVRNSHGAVEINVVCDLPTNPSYMPQGTWIVNPGATDCSMHYFMLGPSCPAHEVTAGCPTPAPDDYPAYPASPPSSCCPPSSSSTASSSSSGTPVTPCVCPDDFPTSIDVSFLAGTATDPDGNTYSWDDQGPYTLATVLPDVCTIQTAGTEPFSLLFNGVAAVGQPALKLNGGGPCGGCAWIIVIQSIFPGAGAHPLCFAGYGAEPTDPTYSQEACDRADNSSPWTGLSGSATAS